MLTRIRLPDGGFAWSDDSPFDPERVEFVQAGDDDCGTLVARCRMPSGEPGALKAEYGPDLSRRHARRLLVAAFQTYYAAHRYARGYRPTDAEVKAHCHAVTGTRPA